MSLAEKNAAQTKKIIASAGPFIDTLATVADQIKLADVAKLLRGQRQHLEKDTFWLPVLGRFRNGKSTFLNSLLCELTQPVPELGAAGPLPVKDLPTTATLTVISYGANVGVTVVKKDNRQENWSLSRFRTEGVIRRNPEENASAFKDIVRFELFFPSRTLQSGITILDTPGTDDIRERTEIVEAVIGRVDAAIVLLRSDALGGEDERRFIQSLRDTGLNELFFVINRREGRPVDDEIKHEAWYRVVELCMGGERYNGQDPGTKKIYFIDAKAALDGRLRKDTRAVADSGLALFEQRLSEFLEKERRPVHVRRFVNGADAQARGLDETIQKLIPTIKTRAEEFKSKVKSIDPLLKDIERRKNSLPKLIDSFRVKAELALDTSFRQMISDLCRDLPTELGQAKMPSIDEANWLEKASLALPWKQKKVEQEVTEAAKAIYQARLASWQLNKPPKPGLQQVMGKLIDEMNDEIAAEIRGIKRQFDKIQFELTGFAPSVAEQEAAAEGWLNRVAILATGVIMPDYPIGGMLEGWKGVLRGVGIHAAVGFVVGSFGGPIGWGILASIVLNTLYQIWRAPGLLKEKFRQRVADGMIPELRKIPDQYRPDMAKKIGDMFEKLSKGVLSAIEMEIAKEEQTLREQAAVASKSAEEKQKLLAGLEQCRAEVARCRKGLQDTLIAVEAGRL